MRLDHSLPATLVGILIAAASTSCTRIEEATVSLPGRDPASPQDLDSVLSKFPIRPIAGGTRGDRPEAWGEDEGQGSFLVGGHLYGRPGRPSLDDPGPAPSLVRAIDRLRATRPAFFVSLGDFVWGFADPFVEATLEVFSSIEVPVFNAPGNHEMGRRPAYEARFGRTFGGFRVGRDLFLLLDTELDPWNVSGTQLGFLREALGLAPASGIERAFVFAHKPIFAAGDERYETLFAHTNARDGFEGTNNFARDVRPLLESFARHGELTWFCGDVGAPWSYGMFLDRDPRTGVRYVATGLGEVGSDNVLLVRTGGEGASSIERIALGDPRLPALEDCGLEFWRRRFEGGGSGPGGK